MREPDKISTNGTIKAWKIKYTQDHLDAHMREFGHPPAGICTWLLTGPFHMAWHWWMLSVVSLKDIPGVPPATKTYPEAEYEFGIYSLSGEVNIEAADKADLANRGYDILSPADAIVHFHDCNDEQAEQVCDLAVRAIILGAVSPDSDYRSWWRKAIPNTVEHVVTGGHHG